MSSNKLSFLVVKSHIFEGEAVISYLEMFSFGYELSLPVNCFYHHTSSLASSGRVLWQEAAERKSLGPGVCPGPASSSLLLMLLVTTALSSFRRN